jgi:hypothetical protein
MSFDTPLLFLVFNRPKQTSKVFDAIRQVKPKYLFIAADGPRLDVEQEDVLCDLTRSIATSVDWDCNVKTLFRTTNLGCGKSVSEAITWFFENVEEGIILEDDCLPSADFFTFCKEMLLAYKDDKRIMQISGTNALGEWKSKQQTYHFSNYGSIWGWASWRRAWKYYDFQIRLWGDSEIKERLKDVLVNESEFIARANIFDKFYKNEGEDTWDYQWSFARLAQSGLSIVPSVNLISNIGFDQNATHTVDLNSPLANISLRPLSYPIQIKPYLIVDREFDATLMTKHGVINKSFNRNQILILKSFSVIGLFSQLYTKLKRWATLLI